jgi:heme-degrading monooxygenase HmoA
MLAQTPSAPYYAVMFTSVRNDGDDEAYMATAKTMFALAHAQDGFLGVEYAPGITISYWRDEAAILGWKRVSEHMEAQRLGREKWYAAFNIRVAKVERDYKFERATNTP